MSGHEWATIGGTLLIQIIAAAYGYGKLTSEVGSLKGWLTKVSTTVDNHETRISKIEGALT